MAKMQPYVYSRGQQIGQSFKEASGGLDRAFQNLINQKTTGYNMIKKQVEDIELLKKDTNAFDNEVITKRANDVLQQTVSMIKDKGKLDFSNLSQIKSEIQSISDAKRNSALKLKSIEDASALVMKNAANVTDIVRTINQMQNVLRDPDKLLSPKDISSEIMKIYRSGLDVNKMIDDQINDYLATRADVSGPNYTDSRGDVINSTYKDVPNFIFDKGKYVPNPITDESGNKLDPYEFLIKQVVGPELIDLYQEKAGPATSFDNVINLLKPVVASAINGTIKTKTGMYKEDIERKQSLTKATYARIDLNDKKFELQKEALQIRRALANNTINKTAAQIDLLKKELQTRDAESNSKGIFFDENSGTYVYNQESDPRTLRDSFIDSLLKNQGEGGASTPAGNTVTTQTPASTPTSVPGGVTKKNTTKKKRPY